MAEKATGGRWNERQVDGKGTITEQRMNMGDISFAGHEHQGGCWFCGGDLPKRRRNWCCDEHSRQYLKTYFYPVAANACLHRAGQTCENCHRSNSIIFQEIRATGSNLYTDTQIEIHHIIPLEGEERTWNILNNQDNLMALCHQCHLQVHAAMREPRVPKSIRDKDGLIVAMKQAGQLELV